MTSMIARLALLAGLLGCAGFAVEPPVYLQPDDIDVTAVLSGPPAQGSDEEARELAELHQWQNRRTTSDVLRCKSETVADPFIFDEVLGDRFKSKDLPLTAQLFKQVDAEIKHVTSKAKKKWDRLRPPAVDHGIHPCVPIEENKSYPSAHAVRGIVWAHILAEVVPDKRTQLMDRGRQIGLDREIAGIHFPSDVDAGQKLGEAIFKKLMDNPEFVEAIRQVKQEFVAQKIQ